MLNDEFEPIFKEELASILGLTIKKDDANKVITFLCALSAYTEESQFNISFNAPSSTGKSYIPKEISALFPKEDVVQIGYSSPTAFFHDKGIFDKTRDGIEIDLSHKVLIFLDQPHFQLLEKLRPILSHDDKVIQMKITDKSQKSGMRTKNVFVKGYPAVIFSSAGNKIDEQENTRFLILSPEINQEKMTQSIRQRIRKESNNETYKNDLEENLQRTMLKKRIRAIKDAGVKEIIVGYEELIEELFLKGRKHLKPKHQRDIARVMSLIKTHALLNLWFRKRVGNVIYAAKRDVLEAFDIWNNLSESQENNVPPYIFDFYKDVIVSAWEKKRNQNVKEELTRQEIISNFLEIRKESLADWQLRQVFLPQLEAAGLIEQKPDEANKLRIIVIPPKKQTIKYSESN